MEIFLDLEETLVESWSNPLFCNVQKLQRFFQFNHAPEVHLFSFAVWDEKDRQEFLKDFAPGIEQLYGFKFDTVPTVQELCRADTKVTGVHFDSISDFISVRGKVGAFQSWIELNFQNSKHLVLIDDVVPNISISHRDKNRLVEFINVKNM